MSALIREMDARELIGRLVINPNGAEFVVTRLVFDAPLGTVTIWIRELEDNPEGHETGVSHLDGWEIHQPLVKGRDYK